MSQPPTWQPQPIIYSSAPTQPYPLKYTQQYQPTIPLYQPNYYYLTPPPSSTYNSPSLYHPQPQTLPPNLQVSNSYYYTPSIPLPTSPPGVGYSPPVTTPISTSPPAANSFNKPINNNTNNVIGANQPPSTNVMRRRDRFASYLQTDRLLSLFRVGETKREEHEQQQQQQQQQQTEKKNEVPFAISCDGSSSTGYFQYEMENNPMIVELKGNLEKHQEFLSQIIEEQGILLVPQEFALKNTVISKAFLESHAISLFIDSEEGSVWKSINGFLISFDSKREGIFLIELGDLPSSSSSSSPPSNDDHHISGGKDRIVGDEMISNNKSEDIESSKSLYILPPTHVTTTTGVRIPRVQLLREGQVQFPGLPAPIGLILISDTIFVFPEDFKVSTPDRSNLELPTSSSNENKGEKKQTEKLEDDTTYLGIYKQKIMHIKAKKLRTDIKLFITKFLKNIPPEKDRPRIVLSFMNTVVDSLRVHPLWADSSEAELEITRDNIQKTILKQIFNLIFTSTELKKRDDNLARIIDSLWFVSPEHLDIDTNDWDEGVWQETKKELEAMNAFTLPKEKIQCVLNCSKIIIYLLNCKGGVAGADDFLPHLIFAVLFANPPNLCCNIEFIKQYCVCTDELSEAFYYLTILESVVYFLENISAQSLFMEDELFRKYMTGDIPRGIRPLHKNSSFSPPSIADSFHPPHSHNVSESNHQNHNHNIKNNNNDDHVGGNDVNHKIEEVIIHNNDNSNNTSGIDINDSKSQLINDNNLTLPHSDMKNEVNNNIKVDDNNNGSDGAIMMMMENVNKNSNDNLNIANTNIDVENRNVNINNNEGDDNNNITMISKSSSDESTTSIIVNNELTVDINNTGNGNGNGSTGRSLHHSDISTSDLIFLSQPNLYLSQMQTSNNVTNPSTQPLDISSNPSTVNNDNVSNHRDANNNSNDNNNNNNVVLNERDLQLLENWSKSSLSSSPPPHVNILPTQVGAPLTTFSSNPSLLSSSPVAIKSTSVANISVSPSPVAPSSPYLPLPSHSSSSLSANNISSSNSYQSSSTHSIISPPTLLPPPPLIDEKEFLSMKEAINFIGNSFREIQPTYIGYTPDRLVASDTNLLLSEYRHMAGLLNLVLTLQNALNKK